MTLLFSIAVTETAHSFTILYIAKDMSPLYGEEVNLDADNASESILSLSFLVCILCGVSPT